MLFPAAFALLLMATCHVDTTAAAAFKATDAFKPACGLMTSPGAKGWKRWSDWRTWGGPMRFLGVPGRGLRKWQDVTIPCGVAILLDVPDISVKTLTVKGWLKANYIVVMGKLTAGEPSRHFSSRLAFTLFPTANRKPFQLTKLAPADPGNPRDLGHKAFIVVGGQVQFHGMPGGSDTPSWVRLSETANAGQSYVLVDADVSNWAAGMTVALASTSNDLNEAEHHVIASVAADVSTPGVFRINLRTPLRHTHQGEVLSDGGSGTVGIFGEVALLDRHVSIQGTNEEAPHQYDGGHFIIYMTPTPQTLEGVQFKGLGNQGNLGRYPVHFHICGQQGEAHVVRKNAIVFTRQRCMVIHATGNMSIEDNIAYETKGHCYLLEEGSELNNLFTRNLGINARKVDKVIPPASSSKLDKQTDRQPTTFWLGTPHSNFIDNVAAGSEDSGFWLEATPYMRGVSRLLPEIGAINPLTYNWGEYSGNVAHSNVFGFRTYPHGSYAKYPVYNKEPAPLKDFLIYRNTVGMFFFNSERIVVQNGIFLENAVGIDLSRNVRLSASGCKFIAQAAAAASSSSSSSATSSTSSSGIRALSSSSGSEHDSDFPSAAGPTTVTQPDSLSLALGPLDEIYGAGVDFTRPEEELFKELKTKPGAMGRVRQQQRLGPMQRVIGDDKTGSFNSPVGIVVSQCNPSDPPGPNSIQDSFFSGYGATDDASFALLLTANHAGGFWNTAMFVKGLTFGEGTNKFWATPNPSSGTPPRGGLVARFYAVRDLDGSLLGQSGYAVANYDPILPPAAVRAAQCTLNSAQNAYACDGVCYRAVGIGYQEWGVRPNGMAGLPAYVLRPYSYVIITRLEDGVQFTDYGTDNDNPNNGPATPTKRVRRYLTTSLLAGYTYNLKIVPAPTNPLFYPAAIFVKSYDAEGCEGSMKIVLEPKDGKTQWVTDISTIPCADQNSNLSYQQYECTEGQSKLAIQIGENSYGTHAIVNATAVASQACTESTPCSTSSSPSSSPSPSPSPSPPQTTPYSSDPLSPKSSSLPLYPTRLTGGNIDPFYDPAFYSPT
ncbi:hypothetical protein CLOM_g8217 [Closterium sp. NIES-68]|nr:hypothetical protein CLOM_g8217 [Closterium sp. NIES-68]GJP66127.1 hypothetical protein CLOP_g23039 [Closterium sp. NIES-67]